MPRNSWSDVAKTPRPAAPPPKDPPPPASSIKPLTRDEVDRGIENFKTEFQNSEPIESLQSLIERGQKTTITHCLCLNIGHFMHINKEARPGRRTTANLNTSLHQLAMLEILIEGLTGKGDPIEVYFEDVTFTGPERDHLLSRGYVVTQDYSGLNRMSATTLLFAPCVSHRFIARALRPGDPALYIGTNLDEAIEGITTRETKESHPETEKWLEHLQRFKQASFQTEDLPIFVHRVDNGVECWRYGSVYWLYRVSREARMAARLSREDNQSTLPSGSKGNGKGKGKEIDWWDHEDPPKEKR